MRYWDLNESTGFVGHVQKYEYATCHSGSKADDVMKTIPWLGDFRWMEAMTQITNARLNGEMGWSTIQVVRIPGKPDVSGVWFSGSAKVRATRTSIFIK